MTVALIAPKALRLDKVVVREGYDKLTGITLYAVDAHFRDGSVLDLGIFSGLETACREACTSAYGMDCFNVRVSLPSADHRTGGAE